MLATEFRLKRRSHFTRAMEWGRIAYRPWYTVFIYDRRDEGPPHFGFVISKKISKLAVHRNRLKRIFEDTLRYNVKNVPKGIDMVFLAKGAIAKIMSEDIQRDINAFMKVAPYKFK